ncbi:ligase-associated DNA damage response endonuclease PdeM [Flavobacterium hungaricum]|uniref:Ligase-associated DNA damage response endonuclease PdeM n=1 Tax=Flavobacterium hungaricum TaxID=2082725 RepID=A0ABR9TSL4_9FLAO|nr:ligase-associated DNA damage response endonuclease PdeM [Flavobacterium hungaricum]MBE8728318.1 ligase-associated DNA damage response endonuclease PdeM [Flavobacterium hungaricum]
MKIQIQDEYFNLHSSGALFWEKEKTLIISDVHLGKVSHFRKHGIAIPQNAVAENFKRLTDVIELFCPHKVIFLGDLFHSSKNAEWQLFQDWVTVCTGKLILVAGNHDIIDEKHYHKIGIEVVQLLEIGSFFFTHHPTEKENFFNFSGHIHPGITLRGLGLQTLKLRCFFQKPNQLILPAFGEFTGKYILKPNQDDIVYAIAGNEVILINN